MIRLTFARNVPQPGVANGSTPRGPEEPDDTTYENNSLSDVGTPQLLKLTTPYPTRVAPHPSHIRNTSSGQMCVVHTASDAML